MNHNIAENIAISALQYLSVNEAYFEHFMAYTGSEPAQIGQAIKQIEFQMAVLDFICLDESLLLSFCNSTETDPTAPYNAFQYLTYHSDSEH